MLKAKLREALICLKAGRVTLDYPGADGAAPSRFRGRLRVDARRCIGCGGCANVCPPRCIQIEDGGEVARLVFLLERCIQCARCVEVCPEGALSPTLEFETAVTEKAELESSMTLWMSSCRRCGRCFTTPSAIDRLPSRRWRGRGPEVVSANGHGGNGHRVAVQPRSLVRSEGEVL